MKHLTYEQRYAIELNLHNGKSMTEIASFVGVHKSTISRELKRFKGKKYDAKKAHNMSKAIYTYRRRYKITNPVKRFIISRLELKDSPEQISIHLKNESGIKLSAESIYLFIYDASKYGAKHYIHLRHRRKKRRKRNNNKHHRGKIPFRTSIHDRPNPINHKEEIGHWEIDTIVGKDHKSYALTMVERKTMFTLTALLQQPSKEHVQQTICTIIANHNLPIKTITADNGLEFALHYKITQQTNVQFYFADPYSPWQRGLNENTNGLLRQFIPKGTEITKEILAYATENINNRIRKTLNWKSPKNCIFDVAF